ncbi:PKD domain-containing protein [Cellulomonas sp. HZM]|uniref:PKD domain-containing protein n=1 Tax=Cellulomonas sp. HZM TaxID=1454010 RepID=UPI0026F3E831|nr:PKD domain-containing protein [Cellulomonas sp. HZM]
MTALATVVVGVLVATPARADTAPVDPTEPTTVTADSLPTVQIDGVVWNQQIVGNTVFVGGNFQNARPAGAAAGTNLTSRPYLLAYDLTTGNLISSFAPVLNGQVRDLALSPDGKRLYVAGNFTSINGQTSYRLAAFDTATNTIVPSFHPIINAPVVAVTATNSAVYFGGTFTNVNSVARKNVAAVSATDGSTLAFNPAVDNGSVTSIVAAPDDGSVVIGGSFTSVAGSSNPGYGLARLAASDGSLMPLPVNTYIRDAGDQSGVLSLESDGTSFYGSGYHFGSGGNMEGSFSASWATGAMNWVEDCHGDTYSAFPAGDAVYSASHKHYCGNSGGFPQTDPWTYYRATATSKTVYGTNTADIYGYPDHAGQPSPKFLNWFPTINTGTFTGKSQGPWTVNGNDDYVLMGGEFTTVNGVGQQGLARFAKSSIAPNQQGPRMSGAQWPLSAASLVAGQVRLAWSSNYDRDNQTLKYNLYRTTVNSAPIYTTTLTTPFWKPQAMGFIDKNLTPGSSQKYRIEAVDPFGNLVRSDYVTVTVSADGAASAYSDAVLGSGATSYWRLGEPSGTTVYDWAGFSDAVAGTGVTRGAAGAIGGGDTNAASTFSGDGNGLVATQSPIVGPQTFSIETWFKTTSTGGGKIVGFGNANTGNSSNYDRHIYMTPAGKVVFGVYPGESRTVTSSASYNDGAWHQAVATLGPDGQKLYVDGKRVAQRADTTSAQSYSGYWRIGGDSPWEGNAYFAGSIDDVSIYPGVLTAKQVDDHWVASGRTSTIPAPPSDDYGAAVFNLNPDLYWRLSDSNGSSTAANSGPLGNAGSYQGAVTYQVTGAVPGTNKAITLPTTFGTHGVVVAKNSTNNPTVYSEEIWFKTTTTSGGKLIGFGDATSGTSSSYDRHVYMETDGRLTFGVWTGQTNTITTPQAYNDGAWHQVVATQSSDGMKLYVDGALRGTNPQTAAQAYTGYWRIGGDTTWGPQPWFNGSLDEAAVYPTALTAAQVAQHWQIGTGVNQPPNAVFTSTTSDLTASFDASASGDPDGTIASYAWSFGDGQTGTGVTPTHTYATAGTKSVTLTVTDNKGATASISHDVVVTAPNQPPTAAFTATADGLAVSVDGSASADADGTIASYAWDFGDGASATGATASHTYATSGTKTISLTVKDDKGASATTTRTVAVVAPNQPPTARFTTQTHALKVSVDGSTSTDADGTVASYAWSFGDGTTDTGATASHTYASAGTYTVKLVVTDDAGATDTTTKDVTVAPNAAPTARFTSQVTDLKVSVDGSTSSDTDGTVASYTWTFGDGGTGTGASATHTYATAGTYTVKLTVTDDDGATDSVTHDVTVTAPTTATPLATDAFTRTVSSGWGNADLGGTWTVSGGASRFSVDGSVGKQTNAAGITTTAVLGAVSSASSDLTATVSADKVPGGGGAMITFLGRRAANGDAYGGRIKLLADGTVQLHVNKPSGTIAGGTVPGLTFAAGDKLKVRLQVDGVSPTTVRAKVWRAGSDEPSTWFATGTDATDSLQVAGSVGITSYLSASAANGPVVFGYDDLAVTTIGPAPANQAPHAAFTSTVSDLGVQLDSSSSSDSDGSITSYAWTFGDGGTASTANPSHTYAAAGTYTVKLTVTDDDGASDSVSHDVTVTAPPAGGPIAADAFGRTVAGGWGSAQTGGAWSLTGTASRFSVGDGVGKYTLAAGTTLASQLGAVSSTSTRTEVSIAVDKVPDGSGAYVHVQGRRVAADNYYGARLRFMADGSVQLHVTKGNGTAAAGVVVPGLTYAAGDSIRVAVEVTGTSPTTVRAKAWKVGTSEPAAWQTSTTDATPSLQAAGSVGLIGYLYGNVTVAPVVISFDDFVAKEI